MANTAVFGLYSTRDAVEEAIDQLRTAGYRATDISVLMPDNVGTKDLALEIQATQPGADRDRIEASVKQVVLAAYQLDSYGDVGDAEKAQQAFRTMSTAVAQIESLVSERR